MEKLRKPFQGVLNIIRFNWDYYLGSIMTVSLVLFLSQYCPDNYVVYVYIISVLALCSIVISLLASLYVYDISDLYSFSWIVDSQSEYVIANINAGFDETSDLIQSKYKNSKMLCLDFYNPEKHTEASIKRARKAYPSGSSTNQISTTDTGLKDNTVDKIFITFAAHEIRDVAERTNFFKELKRILKPSGIIYLTEHLRDIPNFLVYNIGCLHFYSKASWLQIINDSQLNVIEENKITPFVSRFLINKNGNSF